MPHKDVSAVKVEIAGRLKLFGQSLFGADHGWKTAFAKALGMGSQQLNDYLSGRWLPGNKMEDRLRKLGCDVVWLMTGEKKEEINRRFNEMIERRSKEGVSRQDREMLAVLHGLGIRNTIDLNVALDIEKTPNVMRALEAAEPSSEYKALKGRKGAKK